MNAKQAAELGRADGIKAAEDYVSDIARGIADGWKSEHEAARGWDEQSGEAVSYRSSAGQGANRLTTQAQFDAYSAAYAKAASARAVELYRERA